MKDKRRKTLENLAFYSYSNRSEMKKGLDRCFLHYGIKQEDMNIIEQACVDNDIDAEWVKENILKPYQDEKNNQNFAEEKKLTKIMKQALKHI